jgi:glycosyltransferase-like protein
VSGSGDPLTIALLTYSTRPRGGVVATLSLAEALARAGHTVDLWTLGRGGDSGFFRPVEPAVRVVAVPFGTRDGEDVGARVLRSIATLRSAFEAATDRYDVVHAQDCISANAVGRCVRTVHHLDAFTTPELVACHEAAIRTPYAHICVSGAVAAELAAGWGITATVIPNGVDAARFARAASPDPDAAAHRSEWRALFGRYVLAVGGIEPRKGTMDLIEAFASLRAAATPLSPGPRLVIAGGETLFDYRDYRAAVERRAADLGVEPVVLGTVAHDALPSLVAAAAAFAFPSVKEGFGLAAMEALAAGVPVVARDLPVLREVFGDTVRFARTPADLADALAAALSDDPTRAGFATAGSDAAGVGAGAGGVGACGVGGGAGAAKRRAAGQALAASHSWDTAAAAHVAFYRRLPTLAHARG